MYTRKRGGQRAGTRAAIEALLRAMRECGEGLDSHVLDVADLADALAEAMEMPLSEREHVRHAAALHDVGKLAIPDSILDKPGPLDDAEWEFMRRHAEIGERILGDAPALAVIGGLVRSSHERWDGTGYPDRLAGTDIPLGARIIALCDAYHAMVTTRPYRTATTTPMRWPSCGGARARSSTPAWSSRSRASWRRASPRTRRLRSPPDPGLASLPCASPPCGPRP
jgi:HD-GYP domain-containing protein (c-di-GMP phosphodiesterase class II)